MSKTKGIYIKNRDRLVRRVSPRSEDEADYSFRSDGEGRPSPEVQVESFGEGNISSDAQPNWPQNFESEPTETIPSASLSRPTVTEALPQRAQRYMVNSDSYKDLTGTKYITVPEPKQRDREPSPRSSNNVSDTHKFGQLTGSAHDSQIPSAFVKPIPRTGTHRGYPLNSPVKQSHLATVRVHPKRRSQRSHMATIRAIPRDGTIRTVRGYHLGHNATVRIHNTGHAVKQMKFWDKPDAAGGFRRTTILADRKEYCFSQFAIELDKPDLEAYTPGDTLSGRIVVDANSNVEIRFVELLIVGVANLHFSKNDPNSAKNAQDVLINKRSYVMGTPDGRWNSVLSAGKYVSKFKFHLPDTLPSSIKYEDKEHGFSFEVAYMVKARICDEMGSSSTRSTHSINNYVKVLMSRRNPFYIRRPFDIHSIPRAMFPVSQSEVVNMNCLPIFVDTASITLSLDRSVFLAGDDIRVKLVTSEKTARRLRSLNCELQQKVLSSIKPKQSFVVTQIHEHEPEGLQFRENGRKFVLFEFIIPTHSQFVPSVFHGSKLLQVSYIVFMTVTFNSCSGRLFLECPIGVGPATDPVNLRKTNSVPIFNRPKRFPHFSRDSNHAPKAPQQNGTVYHENGMKPVMSPYKSKGSSLLCCCIDDDDF